MGKIHLITINVFYFSDRHYLPYAHRYCLEFCLVTFFMLVPFTFTFILMFMFAVCNAALFIFVIISPMTFSSQVTPVHCILA